MTEEETKKCWCPFARAGSRGKVANRDNQVVQPYIVPLFFGFNCIGSQCMAWRWDVTPEDAKTLEDMAQLEGTAHMCSPQGHCGLAGTP